MFLSPALTLSSVSRSPSNGSLCNTNTNAVYNGSPNNGIARCLSSTLYNDGSDMQQRQENAKALKTLRRLGQSAHTAAMGMGPLLPARSATYFGSAAFWAICNAASPAWCRP